MEVAILLSTYNGEKYIRGQIESIINQSYTNWKLYIRDDGSHDNTLNIIDEFKLLHPKKIFLIQDNFGNLRTARSFMTLLMQVQSDFYLFCDQDDIWIFNKIELSLDYILNIIETYGSLPVLVFSDLMVVDKDLNLISPSLWKYSNINPENVNDFYKLATNSTVTGCTMIINDLLKKSAFPFPSQILMHDWWLSLIACRIGVIEYISTPTLLYRQHDLNVLGAESPEEKIILHKLKNLFKVLKQNLNFFLMVTDKRLRTNLLLLYYYKFRKYFLF
jgi:glycosyltransferase involved in cell wall biosynthesis